MPNTSHTARILKQRPLNRYGLLDTEVIRVARLGASAADMRRAVETLGANLGRKTRAFSKNGALGSARELAGLVPLAFRDLERLQRQTIFPTDPRLAITDVVPVQGRIMSNRSFALRVSFAASRQSLPVLASVHIKWRGEPFVVEKAITSREAAKGFFDIRFDKRQTLPIGPAVFHITAFSNSGSQANFRTTCFVLPGNPFSLSLSPNASFVTGTFSARAVKSGSAYDTGIAVTLANGNASAVPMTGGFTWKFWDGGVGGSLVESGTGSFGGFSVPAHNTWGGWINFHSPSGSGIYGKYDNREDMTAEILMSRADGGAAVSGTITARTMFEFGVNITKVAFEDFTSQESADLSNAGIVLREIYERRDVTVSEDHRGIHQADAGGYEVITTDSEAHNLWSDWSGPNTNDNIDMFVINSVAIPISGDGTADGIDGSIPGPTSHDGSNSGTLANKSGFVDSHGIRRLDADYLGMLMGHELGHYLGLPHVGTAGNLMLPSSATTDTALTYDQYRTIINHGWVFID